MSARSKELLKELIIRSEEIRKCFRRTGSTGFIDLNVLEGASFEEWKSDIRVAITTLDNNEVTNSILKLIDGFNGWHDESDFEELVSLLKSSVKNFELLWSSEDAKVSKMIKNKVFVVHGRNMGIRDDMFNLLRAMDVKPMEWNEAKRLTGKPSPYIGEVLDLAFSAAQAIIVLFTPDEQVRLKEEFCGSEYEKNTYSQARPNVIFEAGMALGRSEERTILIEIGDMRGFSDISGRHTLHFNGSAESRKSLIDHLKIAGVDVDIDSNVDWLNVGKFTI